MVGLEGNGAVRHVDTTGRKCRTAYLIVRMISLRQFQSGVLVIWDCLFTFITNVSGDGQTRPSGVTCPYAVDSTSVSNFQLTN